MPSSETSLSPPFNSHLPQSRFGSHLRNRRCCPTRCCFYGRIRYSARHNGGHQNCLDHSGRHRSGRTTSQCRETLRSLHSSLSFRHLTQRAQLHVAPDIATVLVAKSSGSKAKLSLQGAYPAVAANSSDHCSSFRLRTANLADFRSLPTVVAANAPFNSGPICLKIGAGAKCALMPMSLAKSGCALMSDISLKREIRVEASASITSFVSPLFP